MHVLHNPMPFNFSPTLVDRAFVFFHFIASAFHSSSISSNAVRREETKQATAKPEQLKKAHARLITTDD